MVNTHSQNAETARVDIVASINDTFIDYKQSYDELNFTRERELNQLLNIDEHKSAIFSLDSITTPWYPTPNFDRYYVSNPNALQSCLTYQPKLNRKISTPECILLNPLADANYPNLNQPILHDKQSVISPHNDSNKVIATCPSNLPRRQCKPINAYFPHN